MRSPLTRVVALATATFAAATHAGPTAAAPPAPVPTEIAQDNGTLKAVLFRPGGSGPFPAVVGLHSCAGLIDRGGAVRSRYRDWAQHLAQAGFVVLYPDSYGSRGLGSQCAVRHSVARTD